MNDTTTGTYCGGQIRLRGPVDWPEGAEVEVTLVDPAPTKVGLSEEEWRTDPQSITAWLKWYNSIEPLEFTPGEVQGMAEFDEQMRQYNLEAVRRQMEQGTGE